MSHDIKKNKLLKKFLGLFGFKILPKDTVKTDRLIESYSFSCSDLIKFLVNEKKIDQIIQIGANDGKSDDFLFKNLNKNSDAILIEPMNDAFVKLNENYKEFKT